MPKSLYLINPRPSHPSYFGAEVFEQTGYPQAQAIADLAAVTVAALATGGLDDQGLRGRCGGDRRAALRRSRALGLAT